MKISIESAYLIIGQVTRLVEILHRLADFPKDKDNGYCVITSALDGRVLLTFQVGECKPEKVKKYYSLANAKAVRLYSFASQNHVSSWQSRDKDANRWGGAIRAGDVIFSFSGLPELADEAVMLVAAVICNFISLEEAEKIAIVSDNVTFSILAISIGYY